jgi:hypothetical protein
MCSLEFVDDVVSLLMSISKRAPSKVVESPQASRTRTRNCGQSWGTKEDYQAPNSRPVSSSKVSAPHHKQTKAAPPNAPVRAASCAVALCSLALKQRTDDCFAIPQVVRCGVSESGRPKAAEMNLYCVFQNWGGCFKASRTGKGGAVFARVGWRCVLAK